MRAARVKARTDLQDLRARIVVEDAEVLAHTTHAGNQYLLRLRAPTIAARALPGSFLHVQCDPLLRMRRPMSLMRVNATAGWIEIFYKVHGVGTQLLTRRTSGEKISIIGPIGVPFKLRGYRRRPLLIGGGIGIPPMIFLAEHIKDLTDKVTPFIIMGSEVPFPFKPRPSKFVVKGVPDGVIGAMPLMEDWGIPSRLASQQGYPGSFDGYVTDLARHWLTSLSEAQRAEVELFGCGPTPMLETVATLAQDFRLPCQISLEEYMACAVGGCAGCAVKIQTDDGVAMRRICVDGPVFDVAAVVFS